MTRLYAAAVAITLLLTTSKIHSQVQSKTTIDTCNGWREEAGIEVRFRVIVPDWRQLGTQEVIETLLESGSRVAMEQCRAAIAADRLGKFSAFIVAENSPIYFAAVTAQKYRTGASWTIIKNNVPDLVRQEERDAEQRRRLAAEEEGRKLEAEARAKRKESAQADCGTSPKISGGPWFSSTYSVAANDEARRGFFCVKLVEYVSAAPNPFGGKAARARFIGYNTGDFQPTVQVRDFAY
jgi:hypothetical protein